MLIFDAQNTVFLSLKYLNNKANFGTISVVPDEKDDKRRKRTL